MSGSESGVENSELVVSEAIRHANVCLDRGLDERTAYFIGTIVALKGSMERGEMDGQKPLFCEESIQEILGTMKNALKAGRRE